MDRMRSWNSSEYESCGLQPYEISNGGEKREEEKRVGERGMHEWKKGITAKGIGLG